MMSSEDPSERHRSEPAVPAGRPPRIRVSELLAGALDVVEVAGADAVTVRITANGKLILTK